MVIFSETMAKLVRELAGTKAKITVSEETVVFDFIGNETGKAVKAKTPPAVEHRRGLKLHTWNGETHTIKEWAEKYSVPYKTMVERLKKGSPETKQRRGKEPKRLKKG